MSLVADLFLALNSAFAGGWLFRSKHPAETALGCFSALAVIASLIARFA